MESQGHRCWSLDGMESQGVRWKRTKFKHRGRSAVCYACRTIFEELFVIAMQKANRPVRHRYAKAKSRIENVMSALPPAEEERDVIKL